MEIRGGIMQEAVISYVAVLVAAIANMVLGSLWFGPLFGKIWMKWSDITSAKLEQMKKQGMGKTYTVGFIASLIMSYVLAHFVDYVEATTLVAAVQLAFWVWLGFIATVQIGGVLWEGKPVKLFALTTTYQLVSLVVMAIILTLLV